MRRSLRSWVWRVPIDREVEEELAFHIEMRTRELIERGLDPKTARETVLARIGDLGRLKRTCVDLGRKREREMRLTRWLVERGSDIRFAVRQMKASPGFAAIAVVTLALGIGANSAIFALADATLLRPLPFPDADRLVMVWETSPAVPRGGVSPANLRDFEDRSGLFDALGAVTFGAGGGPLVEGPDGTLVSTDRQVVSERFFDVLGVTPVLGRTFRLSDGEPSATPVVVIAEGLWRARFGADPALVGREIRLNGEPFTVIGVVPDDAQLQRPARVWSLLPLRLMMDAWPREARGLQVIGRLKPGIGLSTAEAELRVVAETLAREYPATNTDWSVVLQPLRTGVMGPELQETALFLLAVVGFVLLLCCVNVANLLLARGSVRARELAVRSALGAGKLRIVSQLLTESLVLAAIGGLLGALIGSAILTLAPAVMPAGLLPAAATLAFDARVVAFCAVAAVGAGVLFGLVPAWQATKTALVRAIASDGRSVTRTGGRVRSLLVAAEIAAAVMLLCGAGLLLRTVLMLGSVDPGYRADGDRVLTLDFSVPFPQAVRYPTFQSLMPFYDEASRAVSVLPGVRAIGWGTGLPHGTSDLGQQRLEIIGDPPAPPSTPRLADFRVADAGYFTTLDIPLLEGRAFTEHDTSDSLPVSIVSDAFVQRYLAGRDPIGVRISVDRPVPGVSEPTVREIVGVVRQVEWRADDPQALPQVYAPLTQFPWPDTYLVVQTATEPAHALVSPIREAIASIDRDVPVRRERTLTDLAALTTAPHRFRAIIVGTFATLALVLAMVGIFGILAYAVEQRTREIGVRIALGATAGAVLRLVLGSATRMVAIGAVIGLAAAAVLARSLSAFLFGVQPLDPWTFAAVAVTLGLTAVVACAIPALRAVRVDPVVAFRNE